MICKFLTTIGLILLWCVVVITAALAEAMWFGEPPVERGNFASIENYLVGKMREAAKDERLGSAALALVQNGEIAAKHGFGVSNAENQTPVNPEKTLFQLASVSKAVTAFGVMKLVEENKLGLDEPVMRYLKRWRFPGSEAYRDKVTVRHLLTHTAALYDGARFGIVEPGEKMPTLEESLNAAGSDELKIIAEPGTSFVYGNGNSAVLQLLVEDVTGKPFAEYMKETVLQPLGMNESSFDAEPVAQNIAPDFDSSLKVHPRRRYTAAGAVALYASATDIARFALAFTGENPVLKRGTINQMLAPQSGTNGTWGLGQTLYIENGAGGFVVGHDGGAIPAWGAAVRFNPATGNGFVLLVSGGSGATNRLSHDWIYWETGKMTAQGKRQVFYDRMKGLGLAALILGTLVILFWRVFGAKFRRSGKNAELKNFAVILGFAAILFLSTGEANAQNDEALRVLNSALDALGGEAKIKSFKSVYFSAKGTENGAANGQSFLPGNDLRAAHEEKLAVFLDGVRLAYEYKTERGDGTTRHRRFFFNDGRRFVADFGTKAAFSSAVTFPSVDRNQDARRFPHIFLIEVLENASTPVYLGIRNFDNKEHEIISVTLPNSKIPVSLFFDKQTHLLSKYEYTADFPALGASVIEYVYSGYQNHPQLVRFPAEHAIKINGKTFRDVKFEKVSVDSEEAAAMLKLPAELEGFVTPAGTVKEVAKGVYFVYNVGGYQPMFVEFKDFILAIEAPAAHPSLEETPVENIGNINAVSEEFIARIKQTVPNKPIKYIVATHCHSDHMGGLRAFIPDKPTVLTTPGNKMFYEKFVPELKIETFDKKQAISDGEKTVELINVGANPHTAENIVVYFPTEKFIFQGDLFYFNNEATFPLKDRLPVMFFFAGWLKKNNISPARIYGFHSPMFASGEHIEKLLEMSSKLKK